MDFSLNDVQAMLADSVEKFIANDYDFDARQKHAGSETGYSADVWQTMCELGWAAVPFSEEDGGLGGGPVETMVLMQRFGQGLIVEPYLANVVLAGGVIARLGNDTQKADWLGAIISGELQSALALVEPQSRYNVADVRTRATADGDGWVLNGNKGVVLNGGNAELLLVPARTGGDATDEAGISVFAVDANTDGLSIRRYPTVDGHQAAEISLNNVTVGADRLLGDAGEAFTALSDVVDDATLAVCAEAVGIMQTLTQKTVEYTKNRQQFGVPISTFQALQHRMVDMFTASEQAYSLLVWATMAQAEGKADAKRAIHSMKYQVGTSGKKVGQEAVQLHGGMGVTWELDVAHYFKRLTTIGQLFGTADWHLDQLAD